MDIEMQEEILNTLLTKLNDLSSSVVANKESTSKILMYLANKNKELEDKLNSQENTILELRNDLNEVIEGENNLYIELQNIKSDFETKLKSLNDKIQNNKNIDLKLNPLKEDIKGLYKSYDDINNLVNNCLVETKNYILIDYSKKEPSKIKQFFYKIFNYRKIRQLKMQKEEEERLRIEKQKEEEERLRIENEKRKAEEAKENEIKKKQQRSQIKEILNSKK